eukprot:1821537-Ditylum_brightwellii.AAC.1
MAQWALKANVNVVLRCTVFPLLVSEENNEREVAKRTSFDECIKKRWGSAAYPSKINAPNVEVYSDNDESPSDSPEVDDPVDSEGYLVNQ